MKPTRKTIGWLALLTLATLNLPCSTACAQTTELTYQGRVQDNGTNFTGTGLFKFALVTSTNNSHQATGVAVPPSGGYITIVNVTYGGSGYTTAPAVTISGGGGSGATAIAAISGGVVTTVTVSYPGSGYTSTPSVAIAPPPSNISYTTYWSNDGTGSGGNAPVNAVAASVSGGLFTVVLGDTSVANMTGINPQLFALANLQVRIWFSDGVNSFAALDPAQYLTAAPYSAFATATSNLLGTLPATQLTGSFPACQLSGSAGNFCSTNITFTGTINGNGSGLTSLNAANLTGSATLNNLYLPATTSGAGIIYSGGTPLLQAYGSGNFFAGYSAGNFSLTGGYNVAVGSSALNHNTTGASNAAFGLGALYLNTGGTGNTASGYHALYANTNGQQNTAVGYEAMSFNTSGYQNTATGAESLYFNTTGYYNTAAGFTALYSNTVGAENTAAGYIALYSNTNGNYNTALGAEALTYNRNGSQNTATGAQALCGNVGGSDNTATGVAALYANVGGSHNTATGVNALSSNTNGNNNTADGDSALSENTSGAGNTAVGTSALSDNVTGSQNTASGDEALDFNQTGSYNTACGQGALLENSAGNYNTAIGAGALQDTLGNNNIGLGYLAGWAVGSGHDNIDVANWGNNADAGTIRIGTAGTQTITYISGIYGVTAASGVAVYVTGTGQLGTLTSSARFKTNIQSMDDASEVLLSLKPVTFRYKPEIDPQGVPQFGLVAEDVEKADSDLVAHDDTGRPYTVRYEAINAMLLNEFLKQHRKVEAQKTEIEDLRTRLEKLESLLRQPVESGK